MNIASFCLFTLLSCTLPLYAMQEEEIPLIFEFQETIEAKQYIETIRIKLAQVKASLKRLEEYHSSLNIPFDRELCVEKVKKCLTNMEMIRNLFKEKSTATELLKEIEADWQLKQELYNLCSSGLGFYEYAYGMFIKLQTVLNDPSLNSANFINKEAEITLQTYINCFISNQRLPVAPYFERMRTLEK
jgi:hypothetical protein